MGSSEKFCLRWNDFESNISVAFREIREEKDFFDCTLSCGARQIQAHKLILSACSPFFRSILRQNPHQHPLLYLKGVEFTDLQAVLNFMYHGEVNVAQEELNSFLAVAEDLKVKGLTQGNSSESVSKPKPEPFSSSIPRQRPPREEEPPVPKRPRPPPPAPAPAAQRYQDDDDIQEVMPVVKQEPPTLAPEPTPPPQPLATLPQTVYQPTTTYQENTVAAHPTTYQENTVAQMDESYGEDGYDYGGYEGEGGYEGMDQGAAGCDQNKGFYAGSGLDYLELESMISVLDNGLYCCTQCGKEQKNKKDLKRHISRKHVQGPIVSCQFCGKEFKNQPSLQVHISQHHRDEYSTMKQNF